MRFQHSTITYENYKENNFTHEHSAKQPRAASGRGCFFCEVPIGWGLSDFSRVKIADKGDIFNFKAPAVEII